MHDSKRKRKRPLALLGGHHQKIPIEIEASAQACVFEGFLLVGRNVLADQMEYLAGRLPKHSRILAA